MEQSQLTPHAAVSTVIYDSGGIDYIQNERPWVGEISEVKRLSLSVEKPFNSIERARSDILVLRTLYTIQCEMARRHVYQLAVTVTAPEDLVI